jgi:hypothetical protein
VTGNTKRPEQESDHRDRSLRRHFVDFIQPIGGGQAKRQENACQSPQPHALRFLRRLVNLNQWLRYLA